MDNNKLTLLEIINFETELELIKQKVRLRFAEPGIQSKIHRAFDIDATQLCDYRAGRREFGIKRLIKIAKFLVKEEK